MVLDEGQIGSISREGMESHRARGVYVFKPSGMSDTLSIGRNEKKRF
jgi:hypothetical protein